MMLITIRIDAIIAQQGFSISANSALIPMSSTWSAFWCCASQRPLRRDECLQRRWRRLEVLQGGNAGTIVFSPSPRISLGT
jgi:hypothetical protein